MSRQENPRKGKKGKERKSKRTENSSRKGLKRTEQKRRDFYYNHIVIVTYVSLNKTKERTFTIKV